MKIEQNKDAPSFEKISACVHCGLCLEACPTYRELRVEMDSPRGRIYLMKGILDERIEPTEDVLGHLDQCLDCRACETACPSGVEYGSILEKTRTLLEPERSHGLIVKFLRWFLFRKLLPNRKVQEVFFKMLWVQQILGLTAIGRILGRRGWLPGKLGAMAAQAPRLPLHSFRRSHKKDFDLVKGLLSFKAPKGTKKRRVALFTGCLADQLFAGVNQATVDVLTRNGCDVDVLASEQCCGALHIHNGARDQAKELAKVNVRAFNAGRYDAIVTNAAGCSAELRHYGELLDGDPAAKDFGKKIRDISEFLVEIGYTPPKGKLSGKVAYDEPCHLLHAQKISAAPKQVLADLPGIERVPLEEADACCGSAGIYSVTQPKLSKDVLARKIEMIKKSGCDTLVTGNPGCILQFRFGLREANLPVKVLHPVELLAQAYQQPKG
ncbi:MAG TPA: heterodisulfide reductase-related iron-sulfur binding cluster [Planctomycetota bacterium]|nr:heterodisulfide reductase-related iron-sulfur binding cluster [Planctomycetota bacterium]